MNTVMYNYNEYENFWSDPNSDYQRLLEPYLISTFENYKNASILEIGFGSGHLARILHDIGFSGSYLGVDIDTNAVKFASQKVHYDHFVFEKFLDYTSFENTNWDLAVFCLSICEMSDEVITNYLNHIRAKKILIINPSTITNYFESKVTKPFLNKLVSRLGSQPKWHLIAKIPDLTEYKRAYLINNNSQVPASMYYRSTGDLLNLIVKAGYLFDHYHDLRYMVNTPKIAPVSKFEVLWFVNQHSF
jgi:SAM-dependent methyltransferase